VLDKDKVLQQQKKKRGDDGREVAQLLIKDLKHDIICLRFEKHIFEIVLKVCMQ